MGQEPRWIERTGDLERELANLPPGPLGVDTEADSMHHYREKVCLIQISAGGVDRLIDPLGEIDLGALGRVLADAGRRKLLHGADYDLRMLRRDFSFEVVGLFDTMIAARLVGEVAFGLAALLEKYLGVRLDKRFQRADWSRRPLTGPMRNYAAADTHYLEDLAGILERKLVAEGRESWAREEFRRLESFRPRRQPSPGDRLHRVKGARRLDRRGLAVLRALLNLRDRIAQARDRPPFRVVRDQVLLEVAESAIRGEFDPDGFPGLPRSWQRGARRRSLLDEVERALGLPEDRWPDLQMRTRRQRDPELDRRVRALCRERDRLAAELGIEPAVLASRSVLEEVSRRLSSGESPDTVDDLRRWQWGILEPVFRRAGA